MSYEHVEWLLDCKPRLAQLEAISRSHYGHAIMDHKDDVPRKRMLPGYSGQPFTGFGYFMRMRVGKTPTALNQYLLLKKDYDVKVHIVFAPNKYKKAWAMEAERFGLDVRASFYDSDDKMAAWKFLDNEEECQLSLNYEAAIYPNVMNQLERWIGKRKFLLTLDESVAVKNRSAVSTRAINDFAKEADYVRILTGKPLVQGPQDYYSQLRMIRELEGINFFQFRNTYCLMGGHMGKQVVGVKNEERLGNILKRRTFIAERRDWMESFEPDYEQRRVSMTPAQAKAYKEFDEEFALMIDDDLITAEQAITKAMKLQQISSGFIYNEDKKPVVLVPIEKLPKFIDLKELLENEISGKVIVLAMYNYTLDALHEALAPYGCAIIRGGMTSEKVEEEKARFNTDPNCRVILGQFKAIKYGHTLMGSPEMPCLDTVYFENSYSLDDRAQTEERNQGAGQVSQTHIIDYITCPTDKKIADALTRKENIASAIIAAYRT